MSFGKIREKFPNEEACRGKLYKMIGWSRMPSNAVVVSIDHDGKKAYQCKSKYCFYQTSATVETIMEYMRLPVKVQIHKSILYQQ